MKSFLKFLISIVVILLIVGTVYFFINQKSPMIENDNEKPKVDEIDTPNEDEPNDKIEEVIPDDEISIRNKIDEYVFGIDSISFAQTISDNLGIEFLGQDVKQYIEFFSLDNVNVDIIKKEGKMIAIIPAPDFVDNQTFYYKDGKLVMYRLNYIGIGGETKYYFNEDKLIMTETNSDDAEDTEILISRDKEPEADILSRASKIYEKYMK